MELLACRTDFEGRHAVWASQGMRHGQEGSHEEEEKGEEEKGEEGERRLEAAAVVCPSVPISDFYSKCKTVSPCSVFMCLF